MTMSDSQDTSPPPSPKLKKAKAQPKAVPVTLTEFMSVQRASAPAFVRAVNKLPALGENDLRAAFERVRGSPSAIIKVLDLTRAATSTVPYPSALLRWCEEVVRLQDNALANWARDPAQETVAAFSELASWAFLRLKQKGKPEQRKVAEACLSIGLNLLMARRSLPPIDVLRSVLHVARRGSAGRHALSAEQASAKALARSNAKQLIDLARIIELCEAEISVATGAQLAALRAAADLQRDKEELEKLCNVQQERLAELNLAIADRDKRTEELATDLETVQARGIQDASKLKARFRRRIGEELGNLLTDAWDAIDTNPPHPNVTRERIEMARDAIQRELEWLDKSSG
jgi:hypothetical protein